MGAHILVHGGATSSARGWMYIRMAMMGALVAASPLVSLALLVPKILPFVQFAPIFLKCVHPIRNIQKAVEMH